MNAKHLPLAQQVSRERQDYPASLLPPISHPNAQAKLSHATLTPYISQSPAVWDEALPSANIASDPKCTQLSSGGISFKQSEQATAQQAACSAWTPLTTPHSQFW